MVAMCFQNNDSNLIFYNEEFNKLYNNKISFVEPNQKGLSYWNAKPTKETLTRLEKRHPQYDFLNLMTKEEAFKIFKEHG